MSGPLAGLIPACHTPLGPDAGLNLGMVERQAELLLEMGIRGVFVGGTTGEFASLTLEERMDLAGRWWGAPPAVLKPRTRGVFRLPDRPTARRSRA